MTALILSGGIYHPFAETSAAVADHLAPLGLETHVAGIGDGLDRLSGGGIDLVIVNALAFSMVQADKYAPLRARHAFDPSDARRAALADHVARGGAVLGLHTAAICFDTWPGWADLLGVGWVWGRSHHPMPEYLTVSGPTGQFVLWDELYCDLALDPATEVLATATSDSVPDGQPVLTARGRSVYLALGHDLTATSAPGYGDLLRWAARRAMQSDNRGA